MKKLLLRFKAAWYAFNFKPITIYGIKEYTIIDDLLPGNKCDNNYDFRGRCTRNARYCVSDFELKISLEQSDHYHVCERCSEECITTNKRKE